MENETQVKAPTLTPKQKEIYSGLAGIGPEIAAFILEL